MVEEKLRERVAGKMSLKDIETVHEYAFHFWFFHHALALGQSGQEEHLEHLLRTEVIPIQFGYDGGNGGLQRIHLRVGTAHYRVIIVEQQHETFQHAHQELIVPDHTHVLPVEVLLLHHLLKRRLQKLEK